MKNLRRNLLVFACGAAVLFGAAQSAYARGQNQATDGLPSTNRAQSAENVSAELAHYSNYIQALYRGNEAYHLPINALAEKVSTIQSGNFTARDLHELHDGTQMAFNAVYDLVGNLGRFRLPHFTYSPEARNSMMRINNHKKALGPEVYASLPTRSQNTGDSPIEHGWALAQDYESELDTLAMMLRAINTIGDDKEYSVSRPQRIDYFLQTYILWRALALDLILDSRNLGNTQKYPADIEESLELLAKVRKEEMQAMESYVASREGR